MTVVIKVGGSLMDVAGRVLSEIESSGISALIIPGGGVFADAVRAENPDDDTAHWQAIASMNRYGMFLSTFGYPTTVSLQKDSGVHILLPEKLMREADPLPHSWDITSDSIALWIAEELKAPLLLVKSRDGNLNETDFVDSYFQKMAPYCELPIRFANGRVEGSVAHELTALEATRL